MKRFLILSLALLGGCVMAQAQDMITTQKGEEILAKVLEVSSKEVRFKRYSNLEGPTYTLKPSEIIMIRYENGEKDIFDGEPYEVQSFGEVYPGMRYRDYKDLYDTRYYVRDVFNDINPVWTGIASFFIPGLGQCISGEWGRGIGIFAANVALDALLADAVDVFSLKDWEMGYGDYYELSPGTLVLAVGASVLYVWNIVDAVRVTKIKNMYYQDLRGLNASIDFRLEPFFSFTPVVAFGGYHQAAGLSLKVNF
ncbi:MAG: hypothetical protein IKX60_04260 [Bacteroidales bacterium]|nr:hypothetical protein [Bacteroidales bacterium]